MSARPEVHLWLRDDGEPPKAIEAGATPPGPGRVVAVRVTKLGGTPAEEARNTLRTAETPFPAEPAHDAPDSEWEAHGERLADITRERERARAKIRAVGVYERVHLCAEHARILADGTAPLRRDCAACDAGVIEKLEAF